MRAFLNSAVKRDEHFRGLFSEAEYAEVDAYFRSRDELRPSPLRSLPDLAAGLGIGQVQAKDETGRFGLNAFKIVGVQFAAHKLGAAATRRGLVCATAGNHGRAVAHVARELGVPCTVFVPAPASLQAAEHRTRSARLAAMRADGAHVVEIDGTYEQAVERAADHGQTTGATILSDTSWDGYEEIPRGIMAGYTRVFQEASAQWESPPDIVLVQAGVGGLVCAAASWLAWTWGARRPYLIACEPDGAACLLESARAGDRTLLPGPLATVMAGLRCAEPSPAAWPTIADGVDAFLTVSDEQALDALAALNTSEDGRTRIEAGPSGACGVAALVALTTSPELVHVRHAARLDRSSGALIIVTEGA